MMNKKLPKLLMVMSIPLLISLTQFFLFKEMLEKYGDLDFSQRKEHHLKSKKPDLPSHGLEKIFQFFFLTIRTITGKSTIVKLTTKTIKGVSRIAPYQPKKLTVAERMEHARGWKILQEICETQVQNY